jgi:hypothetical protein
MRGCLDYCSQSVSAGAAWCRVVQRRAGCPSASCTTGGCTSLHQLRTFAPAHQRVGDTATLKFTEKRRHVMRKYYNQAFSAATKPPTPSTNEQRTANDRKGQLSQTCKLQTSKQELKQALAPPPPAAAAPPSHTLLSHWPACAFRWTSDSQVRLLLRCVLAGASESVCV